MRDMFKLPAAAIIGFGAIAFSASSASARVVCNDEGDCWHTHAEYEYSPGLHLRVYPDDWRWGSGERYRWREHEGKGYWMRGEWKEF